VEYKNLIFEKHDSIAVMTFKRPAVNNTLSVDLMQELEALADELQSDLEARAVVFTGAGKHFCLGADVPDPKRQGISTGPVLRRYRRDRSTYRAQKTGLQG
jgi:enoyl-CoA hydratase/carnithine racemase